MGTVTFCFVAAVLLFIGISVASDEVSVPRTLLLSNTLSIKDSHSRLLKFLEATGREVDVRAASDEDLRLRDWDIWLYNELIIFAPQAEGFGGAVDNSAILEFIDAGHPLVIAVDTEVTDEQRELISDLGVDLEPTGHVVIDHFNHVDGDPDHAVIMADAFVDSKGVWGKTAPPVPVLYRGTAMSMSPDSQLGMMALSAAPTAYSAPPGKVLTEAPALAGSSVGLAALVQTRSGARVAVIGSVELFGDDFGQASVNVNGSPAPAGNEAFAMGILKWTFGERGVLKVSKLRHRHAEEPGNTPPPEIYRINDHIAFSVDIEELSDDGWQPFRADDVQVEMVMLDPYIRQTLRHNNQGTFSTIIHVPDVYGVFKFVIDHKRAGYTHLQLSEEVPVRPYKHNEFERFLTAAYPYYASATSTMAALFLFSFVALYAK